LIFFIIIELLLKIQNNFHPSKVSKCCNFCFSGVACHPKQLDSSDPELCQELGELDESGSRKSAKRTESHQGLFFPKRFGWSRNKTKFE
jgi:hypothetical protein